MQPMLGQGLPCPSPMRIRAGQALPLRANDMPMPLPQPDAPAARPASRALAESLGVAFAEDLASRAAAPEFVERIPIGFARQHGVIGLAGGNGRMPVALGDLA